MGRLPPACTGAPPQPWASLPDAAPLGPSSLKPETRRACRQPAKGHLQGPLLVVCTRCAAGPPRLRGAGGTLTEAHGSWLSAPRAHSWAPRLKGMGEPRKPSLSSSCVHSLRYQGEAQQSSKPLRRQRLLQIWGTPPKTMRFPLERRL